MKFKSFLFYMLSAILLVNSASGQTTYKWLTPSQVLIPPANNYNLFFNSSAGNAPYVKKSDNTVQSLASLSGSGGSGSAVWGNITGTITNQADLNHFFIPRAGTYSTYPLTGPIEFSTATTALWQNSATGSGFNFGFGDNSDLDAATNYAKTKYYTNILYGGNTVEHKVTGSTSSATTQHIVNEGFVDMFSYLNATPLVYGEAFIAPNGASFAFNNGGPFAIPANHAAFGYAAATTQSGLFSGANGKMEYQSTYSLTPGMTYDATTAGYVAAHQTQYSFLHRAAGDARWLSSSYSVAPTSASAPLSINTNTISISQATTSTDGYLSSTDWNTFNGKQNALVAGSNITISSNTISATVPASNFTINTTAMTTGNAYTITAAAGTLTGATLNSGVTASSLTSVGTLTTGTWNASTIGDSYLTSSYVKADGSRALTADWGVGTFNITGIKSYAISGTAGNGYGEFIAQSSNASAPSSSGFRIFAGSTGSFNWARKNGTDTYVRTFDATLTADRTYTLPDLTGTIATINGGQTFSSATWNATAIGTQYGGTGVNNSTNTSGSILRSNGTNGTFAASTSTWPNTITVNQALYATGTNAIGSSADFTYNGSTLALGASGGGGQITQSRTSDGSNFMTLRTGANDRFYLATISGGHVSMLTGNSVDLCLGSTSTSLRMNSSGNAFFGTPETAGDNPVKVTMRDASVGTTAGAGTVLKILGNNSNVGDVAEMGFGTFSGSGYKSAATIGGQVVSNSTYKTMRLTFSTRTDVASNLNPTMRWSVEPDGTFTGASNINMTFAGTGGIVGTTTNNNTAAGNVGEYVESSVTSGSAVTFTTATTMNVTSISLTAGDWDVSGIVNFSTSGASSSDFKVGTNSTSATFGGDNTWANLPLVATGLSDVLSENVPTRRYSLASTTTIYLVGNTTFSLGSVTGYGLIRARRVR